MSEEIECIGLYIDEPYSSWIAQGIQTKFVTTDPLPEDLKDVPLVLIGSKAYGTITLSYPPLRLDYAAFAALRDAHRIDEAKRAEYARENPSWNTGPFYAYSFHFEPYPQPYDYEDMDGMEKSCSRNKKIKLKSMSRMKPIEEPMMKPEDEMCPKCGKPMKDCTCAKKDDELLLKPKGPWGDSFPACESYVREHYPHVPDPAKYCAGIYQMQQNAEAMKKSAPEIHERPSCFEIIITPLDAPAADLATKSRLEFVTAPTDFFPSGSIVYMQARNEDLVETRVHKLIAPKPVCPCLVRDTDYSEFTEFYALEFNKAVWTTAYINDLDDSCFAFIESGGSKDSEGKTVPRSLRHLPYKDKDGKVDMPHLRNALARLNQTHMSEGDMERTKAKLMRAAKASGMKVSE